MMMQSLVPKIRPDHLDRLALVYVRQSTMIQVRENIASTARQYDLAGRARDLGWPLERIQVIDQDQGHSGASAEGRDGFQHLVAQVALGRIGAVLSLKPPAWHDLAAIGIVSSRSVPSPTLWSSTKTGSMTLLNTPTVFSWGSWEP